MTGTDYLLSKKGGKTGWLKGIHFNRNVFWCEFKFSKSMISLIFLQ